MTHSEAMRFWLKKADEAKEEGQDDVFVAKAMGCSSVTEYRATRARYKDHLRKEGLAEVVETLRTNVAENRFIDVGKGAEKLLGITMDKLRVALAMLKEEGYAVYRVFAQKPADDKIATVIKVLGPPGTTYRDVASQTSLIAPITTKKAEEAEL